MGREEIFCLLLLWCGLAPFPLCPKRTISDQGHHILIKAALAGLVGELGSHGCGEVITVKRQAAGHKGIHSPSSAVGHCCGIYKHIVCAHMLINASYFHLIALSMEVDCLEKVIPLHLYILIVPGTTS